MTPFKQLRQRIATFREDEEHVLRLSKTLLGADGAPFFSLDLLAVAALKRNLSTAAAIATLIEGSNLLAARAMLRVHIDTSMRFAAAWFVDDPQAFAAAVIRGERLDKLKDREGQQLRDARLVELLKGAHPWLPNVYTKLSGYVHLSAEHLAGTVASVDDATRTISMSITKNDDHYPEDSWIEVLDCAHEATGILCHYVTGYIRTKALSPEQLAAIRAQNAPTP